MCKERDRPEGTFPYCDLCRKEYMRNLIKRKRVRYGVLLDYARLNGGMAWVKHEVRRRIALKKLKGSWRD